MKEKLFSQKIAYSALVAFLPLLLCGCATAGTATLVVPLGTPSATGTVGMTDMGVISTIESTPMATEQAAELVQDAVTQNYKLTLRLGPVASMLAPEQAQSATSGEVMVSGDMAMAGMGGAPPNYHIELAVADATSGEVITDKSVSIDLTNVATNEKTSVPIATMYDVKVGPSDAHFGNNVTLVQGNYKVDVVVGGENATFNLAVPGKAGGLTGPAHHPVGVRLPGMPANKFGV
jgi:hypothetical protein